VPLGFGIWLAHYGFHFLTGLYTVIPVMQNAAASLGWPVLGSPRWSLVGLPKNAVHAFEYGFLCLGFIGSLLVGYRLAEADAIRYRFRVFTTWASLVIILWLAALWLISQPMEMRGTLIGNG
jgi:hypothetical protein